MTPTTQQSPSVPPERRSVWRTGALTGVWLLVVMAVALGLANRSPQLERHALERNLACYVAFGLIMTIPLARFCRSASCIFRCGVIGWGIFSLGYWMAGWMFGGLFGWVGKTPFQVFTMGTILYGIAAVIFWIGKTVSHALGHRAASTPRSDGVSRS